MTTEQQIKRLAELTIGTAKALTSGIQRNCVVTKLLLTLIPSSDTKTEAVAALDGLYADAAALRQRLSTTAKEFGL